MSANLNFISALSTDRATFFDVSTVGNISVATRRDGVDIMESSRLGRELAETGHAKAKMAAFYRDRWRKAGYDVPEQKVQDAATDFVTSRLQRLLGPAEAVTRGDDKQYLFVPGRAERLVCESRSLLAPGQRSAAYEVRQPTGQAMWVDPNDTRSLQRAGSVVEEKEYKAHWYGIRYGVNIPETWEQQYTNQNLEQDRANSAVLAMDEFREQVSTWGDEDRKVAGFMNIDGAPLVLGGQSFSSGAISAEDMLLRIGQWEQLYIRANNQRPPSGMVAPHGDRVAMMNARFTGTSDSAWKVGVEQYPWMANAIWDERLALANEAGTSGRWALYTSNPSNLYIEHLETMVFGPFEYEMDTSFVLLRRHGGVIAKKPEMVMYVDFTP